ncbi:Cytochrome c553 [Poseidonocella pacifica]|uniref:Cytochrome c553 n=1 Tax=Poseidonocella pacifica TaxID=871651 RepID=A0A1I0YCX4_9RHOB|nr:c-type cytochrome [Poseidonocella pacifica]SFB11101.1 Cytochrome c553 [Poseidonocella pacifica]
MKIRITPRRLAVGAGIALLGGAAFFFLAPYNIAASVPHFSPVRWALHGYMQNAVAIRSLTLAPPSYMDPADPALQRLGAGHYATGCASCHGAPGLPRSPIVKGMRPAPPPLNDADFETEEYYWLVRHGLKYTGMPEWSGAHRPDEPWAVAAFMSVYQDVSEEDYREMAFGPSAQDGGRAAVSFGALSGDLSLQESCNRCHGTDGLGRDGMAPKLAGQSATYLADALRAYRADIRQSGFMEPLAASLTDKQISELASHYAGLDGTWRGQTLNDGDAARGEELARRGDEDDDIPSCLSCHDNERRPDTPRITGQDARWITIWLRLWREEPVTSSPGANRMHAAARPLEDEDIADLAAFFAGAEKP